MMDIKVVFVLAFLALAVIYAIQTFRARAHHAAIAKSHGCEEPPWKFCWDKLFGIDLLLKDLKAVGEKRYLRSVQESIDNYGKTFGFNALGSPGYFTADSQNIKAVVSDTEAWGVEPIRYLAGKPWLGDLGFFTRDGPFWKHARAQTRPALAKSEYANFEKFEFHLQNFLKILPSDGSTFDFVLPAKRLVSYGPLFCQAGIGYGLTTATDKRLLNASFKIIVPTCSLGNLSAR